MEYWFPLGLFWSQIVRLQLGYQSHLGPQVSLSMLRRVPDSAPCVKFALDGNIDGLKDLFKRGLASPKDVSSTRGYSILRWALYGKQYQTCKFLVNAGADPDYRYDRSYIAADFATLLHKRWDASEKLLTAFEELIQLIDRQPDDEVNLPSSTPSDPAPNERISQPNLMESGLLHCPHRSVQDANSDTHHEDDSSEQSFDDAPDTL
ncbi:MAG: hypothetical protein L6R38_004121 [Xanthoria sp. 2 TBL-2021]|nr:MAG: hypothetical protein L6R38_004121 [Xanthoria sp. 2 TBL-2021]